MDQLKDAVTFITSTGPLGIIALVLYLGYKRVWVWGSSVDSLSTEVKQLRLDNQQLREELVKLRAENMQLQFLAWAGTGMAERLGKGSSGK